VHVQAECTLSVTDVLFFFFFFFFFFLSPSVAVHHAQRTPPQLGSLLSTHSAVERKRGGTHHHKLAVSPHVFSPFAPSSTQTTPGELSSPCSLLLAQVGKLNRSWLAARLQWCVLVKGKAQQRERGLSDCRIGCLPPRQTAALAHTPVASKFVPKALGRAKVPCGNCLWEGTLAVTLDAHSCRWQLPASLEAAR